MTTAETDEAIGAVYKEYAGVVNQAFTGAEKFTLQGIDFLNERNGMIDRMFLVPVGMPAHLKAIALGALFVVVSSSLSLAFQFGEFSFFFPISLGLPIFRSKCEE